MIDTVLGYLVVWNRSLMIRTELVTHAQCRIKSQNILTIRDTNWYDIVIVAVVAQIIRAFVKAPLLCILSYPDNTILIKVSLKVVKCKQWSN